MLNKIDKIESYNEDKVFKLLDLSNLSFSDSFFVNCIFENCTFINSVWRNTKFQSSTFTSCNINFTKLEGSFLQDVTFNECKLVGIEFYKCNKIFFCINIKQSALLNCNFSDLGMKRASFYKSRVEECYFTGTQLEEADFIDTDLKGSIFHQCKLDKADFRNSKNYFINLQVNTVKKAKFSYPEVMNLLKSFDIVVEM